jgi:tRNA (guanine-N7-)-methyltransferase
MTVFSNKSIRMIMMRQRKLKDLDERMEDLADYLDKDGRQNKGQWRKVFAQQLIASSWEVSRMLYEGVMSEEELEQSLCPPDSQLCLEIGCGKGDFICGTAEKAPDVNFIAIERISDILMLAAEKVAAKGLENVRLAVMNAALLDERFPPHCVDRIYLNFSDPWPKKGYAKRRLTHRGFLEKYRKILKENGSLFLKTDDLPLFEFSAEELTEFGFIITDMTNDLHGSVYAEDNVMTEYERNFSSAGKKINMLRAYLKGENNE